MSIIVRKARKKKLARGEKIKKFHPLYTSTYNSRQNFIEQISSKARKFFLIYRGATFFAGAKKVAPKVKTKN